MSPRWLIGMATAFLMLGIFANITDGFLLGNANIMPGWEAVTSFQSVNVANPTSWGNVITGLGQLMQAVADMLWWNFSFFEGHELFTVIQWILRCISVGIFVAFMLGILSLVRGTSPV